MSSYEWSIIAKLPTLAEAEVIKLLLESEGVKTQIQSADSINPQADVYLLVESILVGRAVWILKNKGITDDDLNFLATGERSQKTDDEQTVPDDSNFWLLFGGFFSLFGGLTWLVQGIPTKHIAYPIEKNIDVRILFSSGPIIVGLVLLKIYYNLNKTRIKNWLLLKSKRKKK